jgi:hypothetical protein
MITTLWLRVFTSHFSQFLISFKSEILNVMRRFQLLPGAVLLLCEAAGVNSENVPSENRFAVLLAIAKLL